jgi:hypothetical protein
VHGWGCPRSRLGLPTLVGKVAARDRAAQRSMRPPAGDAELVRDLTDDPR